MVPDPARLDAAQVLASVAAVLVAAAVAALRVRHRIAAGTAAHLLCACAVLAVASWLRFGQLHVVAVRASEAAGAARAERRDNLQFHEFFHYYLGAKYFPELGYLGLYDCTALADRETAEQDGARPRIAFVRDLADVLAEKTAAAARSDCALRQRLRFADARWAAFKVDLRALQRLAPDAWWQDVVDDKGLNPPPTSLLLGSAVANAIPIRAAGLPTYLIVTSLDLLLVCGSFLALRSSFGGSAAALAAVTFGASFIASYGWLGGAVLRFTWVAALVFGLAAMGRGRWLLAGLLLGWSVCDRVFPAGFAVGAALPLAASSLQRARDRGPLARYALGLGLAMGIAGLASVAAFGVEDWRVFATRLARDAHVHNVLHIGLDKILTYRAWTPQDFPDLASFRQWNERIDATWARLRVAAGLLQAAAMMAAGLAAARRRPVEASVLFGVLAMFTLASPSNYYYVVLAIVPALLLRAAVRASGARRTRELCSLLVFECFCLVQLLAPRLLPDPIAHDLAICLALATFLAVWVAVWSLPPAPATR